MPILRLANRGIGESRVTPWDQPLGLGAYAWHKPYTPAHGDQPNRALFMNKGGTYTLAHGDQPLYAYKVSDVPPIPLRTGIHRLPSWWTKGAMPRCRLVKGPAIGPD